MLFARGYSRSPGTGENCLVWLGRGDEGRTVELSDFRLGPLTGRCLEVVEWSAMEIVR